MISKTHSAKALWLFVSARVKFLQHASQVHWLLDLLIVVWDITLVWWTIKPLSFRPKAEQQVTDHAFALFLPVLLVVQGGSLRMLCIGPVIIQHALLLPQDMSTQTRCLGIILSLNETFLTGFLLNNLLFSFSVAKSICPQRAGMHDARSEQTFLPIEGSRLCPL